MADRRVRYDPEALVLADSRYRAPLPIRDDAWISRAEIVRRIEAERARTGDHCPSCGCAVARREGAAS